MRHPSYERPLTLMDFAAAMFQYKFRVISITALVLVGSAVAIFLLPKKYESEAKLFVRLGRGSASLDPATIGQTISIQESRESEMNSIIDMLQSRGLAERVVDQVGYERILKKYALAEVQLEAWSDQLAGMFSRESVAEPAQPDGDTAWTPEQLREKQQWELAVKEVLKSLQIDSPKKSTTIGVAYRGRTPELAHDVAQAVIDCYRQMHINAYQSGGALEFFHQQFQEQENLVGETEDELRKVKNEYAIVTMKGKQESLQTEITDVRKMQLQTHADLEAAKARVEMLRRKRDELPEEMVSETTRGVPENATDAMRDRLYALEIEERELAAKYLETHPELVKVREQLKSAREIVENQPHERETSVLAVNPIRMGIEREMLLAEANVASLQAKLDAAMALESELIDRLNVVNDLEVKSYEMQRKIDIARDNHRSYAKKLEESRINAALDQEALSNVSVVSSPTMQYKHVSPRRSILAVLSAVFALLCGLAVALMSDYAAHAREMRRIRDAEQARYLRELEVDPWPADPKDDSASDESPVESAKEQEHVAATPGKAR